MSGDQNRRALDKEALVEGITSRSLFEVPLAEDDQISESGVAAQRQCRPQTPVEDRHSRCPGYRSEDDLRAVTCLASRCLDPALKFPFRCGEFLDYLGRERRAQAYAQGDHVGGAVRIDRNDVHDPVVLVRETARHAERQVVARSRIADR